MCFTPHHIFRSIIFDIQKVSPCSYLKYANTVVLLQCSNFTMSIIVCWCVSLWCNILGWKKIWKVRADSWRIQGILRDEYVVPKFFKVVCHTKILFDGSVACLISSVLSLLKTRYWFFISSISKLVVLFQRIKKIW